MTPRKSYRRFPTLTMSEKARHLSDASSSYYGEYQSGESRARRSSYYKSSTRERRQRPPTMIEYAKYVLKLRLLTGEKDKLASLREKIIKIMSERYRVASVFFIPYYRYSKKHNVVLYGLMLSYWFGDRKYRNIPLTWILKESDRKEEIEKLSDILLSIPEDYLRDSLLDGNMALPTVLLEYVKASSETEAQQ